MLDGATGHVPGGGVGAVVGGSPQQPPRVWRRQASYPQRVAIAGSPVGLGCDQQPLPGDHHDDRR